MGYKSSPIPTIKTIKALRGESLTIDLGVVQDGDLTAWMKKDPNDTTYRTFSIIDNRYLFLSKDKCSDYSVDEVVTEEVAGKWYFDVELISTGETEEEVKTIYQGVILFQNDITNSAGSEAVPIISTGGLPPSEFSATEGQTTFPLPYLLKTSSLVFVNDSYMGTAKRTGIGTYELVFNIPLRKNDKVLVTF